MTSQEKIELLVLRELNGELTAQEREFLDQWINAKEDNREAYKRIKRLMQSQVKAIGAGKLRDGRERTKVKVIDVLLQKNRNIKRMVYSSFSLMVVGFCLTLFVFNGSIQERELLLAGVFKVEAPQGQTARFTLPEGSEVWLNAASELEFHYNMETDTRHVNLKGEGYFKVAHDKSRPFIVEGFEHKVKVYGTEFNVKSNPGNHQYEVTLHNGSVGILNEEDKELTRLSPGQQYILDDSGRGMVTEVKNLEAVKAWLHGRYEFKDATLEEIAKKMAEMYDVEIVIKDESLKKARFRCVLEQQRSVIKTLKIFSLTSNLDYEIKKDIIILKRKTKI